MLRAQGHQETAYSNEGACVLEIRLDTCFWGHGWGHAPQHVHARVHAAAQVEVMSLAAGMYQRNDKDMHALADLHMITH